MLQKLWALFLPLLLLVGCGGDATTATSALPLVEGEPTFLFFYTEN